MSNRDRFRHTADRLDRFAFVRIEDLAATVIDNGSCMTALTAGEPPELTGDDSADRELAARMCAGCLVQDACLELDMRWSGPHAVGVFGALPDEDRRELFPYWRARRVGRRGGEQR